LHEIFFVGCLFLIWLNGASASKQRLFVATRAVAEYCTNGWIIVELLPRLASATKQAFLYSSIMPPVEGFLSRQYLRTMNVTSCNNCKQVSVFMPQ